MQKYLFIDRDGTLIDEPKPSEQVDSYELLKFEPGVISALKSLAAAGFRLVIVTNQDGLGTPSLPEESFKGPNDLMLSIFGSEGVTFDEVLICPHFPHENCSCRKPKTGLVLDYLKPGVMDPENSYFIGDRESDVAMGQNMGIKSIRYNREENNWQMIAESIYKSVRRDFWDGVGFLRYLNVNLAVLNLLPIPVLDGGLIMFALLALVFRRRVPEKIVSTLSMTFMVLLLGAMAILIFRDAQRSWRIHTYKPATEETAETNTVTTVTNETDNTSN